ncbi:hypothetical protein WJX73_004743 [Symbiochloris irregularis]|uniref:Thioredoxin domain-containing protein n=1 Tax=Symbiochloris irregularis TaxID=706552 RepID=A0AAW1PVM5_9CHLO
MLRQCLRRQLTEVAAFRNLLAPSESRFHRTFPQQGSDCEDRVIDLQSDEEYKRRIHDAQALNQLAVIDFTAKWCGPCKVFAPMYQKLSKMHSDVAFLKVDIDSEKLQETSLEHGIAAVPTIVVMKDGKSVARVQGADGGAVLDAIMRYKPSTTAD